LNVIRLRGRKSVLDSKYGLIDDLDYLLCKLWAAVLPQTAACLVGREPGGIAVGFLRWNKPFHFAQVCLHGYG